MPWIEFKGEYYMRIAQVTGVLCGLVTRVLLDESSQMEAITVKLADGESRDIDAKTIVSARTLTSLEILAAQGEEE